MIVIALKADVELLLEEPGVGRRPVDALGDVAQQVERGPAERITPAHGLRTDSVDVDAHASELGAVRLEHSPIAGGHGDAVAVEERAPGDLVRNLLEPRIG